MTLHSLVPHDGAPWQHVSVPATDVQVSGVTHLLQRVVVPAGLHEFWTSEHAPEATELQLSVRVQHVPTTPAGGDEPGAPVELFTHSFPEPQLALRVPPQPSES